jgi:drug/metabolite transporter (DMT)-like permease
MGLMPWEFTMNLSLYLLTVLIWGTTWIALKLQGRGRHPGVDRLSLRPGRADPVRHPAAHPAPATDEPARPPDLPGPGLVPVLRQLHVLPHRQPVDRQRPDRRGVFHRHPVERAQCAGSSARRSPPTCSAAAPGPARLGLLFWPELSHHAASRETLYGLGLALLGTLCFSAGNMLSSLQQKAGLKPMTTNAWGMLYGAAMLAVYCLVSGIPFEMEWNTRYIGSLLYLVIPGSVIGFTAYLTLVGRMGPERAAYCTVLFPLVALNVSAFAEGYQWTAPALLGLVVVMAGNVLVFRKPRAGWLGCCGGQIGHAGFAGKPAPTAF